MIRITSLNVENVDGRPISSSSFLVRLTYESAREADSRYPSLPSVVLLVRSDGALRAVRYKSTIASAPSLTSDTTR